MDCLQHRMRQSTGMASAATTRKAALRERARALYTSGMTLRQVADAVGVSSITTIRAYLDQSGTPRRGPGPQADTTRERVCAADGCDNVFSPTRQQATRGHGRFCSRSCANTARRIHAKPTERECAHCGRAFVPKAGAPGTYCSRSCRSRAPRGSYAKARSRWKTMCCELCGTPRQVPLYSELRFCSKGCFNTYRWRTGYGVSDESAILRGNGRLKQVFKGRWAGPKGARAGAELGGPPTLDARATAANAGAAERRQDGARDSARGLRQRALQEPGVQLRSSLAKRLPVP